MISNPSHYHFSFYFTQITQLDQSDAVRCTPMTFKYQLLRCFPDYNKIYRTTPPIKGVTNNQGEFKIKDQQLRITLKGEDFRPQQTFQLRLIQILPRSQSLIGCYQFMLNHYLNVQTKYNRNCIQMNIQLTDKFIISYQVFQDENTNALEQMIAQHRQNKRKARIDKGSQVDFAPQELYNANLQHRYKELKIDKEEQVFVDEKYWSPRNQVDYSKYSQSTKINQDSGYLNAIECRSDYLKPKHTSIVKVKTIQRHNVQDMNQNQMEDKVIEQTDWQGQQGFERTDVQSNVTGKMYKLLQKDTMVLLPGVITDYSYYKQPAKIEPIYKKKQIPVMVLIKDAKKYIFIVFLIITMVILVINGYDNQIKKLHKPKKRVKGRS